MLSDYLAHRRECARKQQERASKIATLPASYLNPLSQSERTILGKPIQDLVQDVQTNVQSPIDVLRAYAKVSLKAQERTNCATEILFPEAEEWATNEVNLKGPLAGVPVSLKDTIAVKGFDVSVGHSKNTNQPYKEDGSMVKILKDAGAVPFIKTNAPCTLLSFESTNDVWGRSMNPHNPKYSPGGSTGGGGALLAFGGSRIEIGSDVAGSVRAPAHFSGHYSLRCSTGRWPKMGNNTSMPGQEGIPSVFSPMTRTLNDLRYFTQHFLQMKPWNYDYSVHPIEWRTSVTEEYLSKPKLRVGVMRTDGVVDPSPACARALEQVASSLRAEGHEVFDITPPSGSSSPYSALVVASQLLCEDGLRTVRSFFRIGEWMDPGAKVMYNYMHLPRPIKYLHYLWVRYIKGDTIWAGLLRHWHEKSAYERWSLVAQRENIRNDWHKWWQPFPSQTIMDIMITPPNATPAVPHDGMKDAVSSCGYTFLFNLLDYSAGILPVTHVNAKEDVLPQGFSLKALNGVAKGAYKCYDAKEMEGLPVGVQVVGRRLEEEKVLACMQRCEDALDKNGGRYRLYEVKEAIDDVMSERYMDE